MGIQLKDPRSAPRPPGFFYRLSIYRATVVYSSSEGTQGRDDAHDVFWKSFGFQPKIFAVFQRKAGTSFHKPEGTRRGRAARRRPRRGMPPSGGISGRGGDEAEVKEAAPRGEGVPSRRVLSIKNAEEKETGETSGGVIMAGRLEELVVAAGQRRIRDGHLRGGERHPSRPRATPGVRLFFRFDGRSRCVCCLLLHE